MPRSRSSHSLFRQGVSTSALALLALVPGAAHAQTDFWSAPADGDWSAASHWSLGQIPDGSNGLFYDVLNSSAHTITHSSSTGQGGVDYIHSYQNTGTGGLIVAGGVLAGSLANAGSLFQSSGTVLNGGTLRNVTLVNSSALSFSNTISSSTLDGVSLDAGLTLKSSFLNIKNSLTYAKGATFSISGGSGLDFATNFTFANATLSFGPGAGNIGSDSSHTLTLDSSLTVTGANASFVGGPLVNNALLSSSLGGLWSFTPALSLVNNGILEARNTGSALSLSGFLTNNGLIQAVGGSAPGGSASLSLSTLNNLGTIQALGGGPYPGGQVSISAFNYAALGTIKAVGSGAAVFLGDGSPAGTSFLTLGNGENLSASGGGTLHLATTLDNTGKTFDPDAYGPAGSFVLSHGRILNGTIANSDDLAFDNSGLTPNILQNVTLSGGLNLTTRFNLGEAEIHGDFHYNPGAVFNIGRGGGELDFVGSHTLDNATVKINGGTIGIGGGTLTLGPNLIVQGSSGAIGSDLFANAGGSLVNDTTITASGSGNFWNIRNATVVNNGTLGVINGGAMSVIADNSLTNTGTIQVGAKSSMTLDTYTQTGGRTAVDGTLFLNPPPTAPFGVIGALTLQGGVLSGTGTVGGNVTNTGGTVRPGLGTLTLGSNGYGGDFTQGPSGFFFEDLAGPSAQFGVLAAGGTVKLDGTLEISLLNGYAPKIGDQFTFLTYGAETGTFASILSASPGYGFSVAYLPAGAILTVDSTPGPAVPEASTTVSLGLLLTLGMGGLVLAARRRKSAPAR